MVKMGMPDNGNEKKVMLAEGIAKPRLTREQIAQRAALELPDGAHVNLGWGIPNLIAGHVPKEITVYFHSENGILGMGPRAKPGEEADRLHGARRRGRCSENREAVYLSADLSGMCRHHHYRSCRHRRETGRIASARSGPWLDRGGSAGVDRRAIDCPPASSRNEFCIIL